MIIFKKEFITFLIILIGSISHGQNISKDDLIATWKLIEKETTIKEPKIDLGELVIFNEQRDTTKVVNRNTVDTINNYNSIRYLKIDKKHATYYFHGHGDRKRYYLKKDILKIDGFGEFKILKLTSEYLVLKRNKEFHYEKTNEDLTDYELFKN